MAIRKNGDTAIATRPGNEGGKKTKRAGGLLFGRADNGVETAVLRGMNALIETFLRLSASTPLFSQFLPAIFTGARVGRLLLRAEGLKG